MMARKTATRNLTFPYQAKSPTLHKTIRYDEKELWCEIHRLLDSYDSHNYTPGAALFYALLLCADSSYFCTAETVFAIEEYMVTKKFNLPLATTIDDAEYERIVIYSAIDEEFNAIHHEEIKKKQNG